MRRLLLMLVLLAAAGLSALQLELRDRACVSDSQVRLRDVAKRAEGDRDLFESLADTVVLELPWERQYRNLYAIELANSIYDKTGQTVDVTGGVCVVRWEQSLIDEDYIRLLAEGAVFQILDLPTDARVTIERVPEVRAPRDGYNLRFELASQSSERIILRSMVMVDNIEAHSFLLHARVEVTRKVLALKTPKRRGETISPDDVTVIKQAGGYLSVALTSAEQLDGLQAARYLPAGAVLDNDNTQSAPAVERGDRILVVVRGEGVQLTLEAESKRRGYTGEMILCENPATGERFEAMVTAPGRAEVNLEDPCAMQ